MKRSKGWNKQKVLVDSRGLEPIKVSKISSMSSVGIADGKHLPWIFLDTSCRKDIEELIENHKYAEGGEVITQWGKRNKRDDKFLYLFIRFINPMKNTLIIELEVEKHKLSIDLLVKNGGCYLQSNKNGTNIMEVKDKEKILLEVICSDFKREWERIYHLSNVEHFKKKGYKTRQAVELAEALEKELEIIDFRMEH